MFIQFRLKQCMAWSMDLEVEAKMLCTLGVKEIHEKLEQWKKYFKENEEKAKKSE